MAISDSKYTGKSTRMKLARLQNMAKLSSYKQGNIHSFLVKSEIYNKSGVVVGNTKFRQDVNINSDSYENIMINSHRVSNSFSVEKSENEIIVNSKTSEGFTVKSTINLIGKSNEF